ARHARLETEHERKREHDARKLHDEAASSNSTHSMRRRFSVISREGRAVTRALPDRNPAPFRTKPRAKVTFGSVRISSASGDFTGGVRMLHLLGTVWVRRSAIRPVPSYAEVPEHALDAVRDGLAEDDEEARAQLDEAFERFERAQPALAAHVADALSRPLD